MNVKKGIILAGGTGSRLYPLSIVINKHLLPISGKPMIYYPLSILMLSGIKDVLIISSSQDIYHFKKLLGNGENLGIKISYEIQMKPSGIAEAFLIGEKFIGKKPVSLILGDNIFHGFGFAKLAKNLTQKISGVRLISQKVTNPNRYGVIKYDKLKKPIKIIEKPKVFISNHAVTGYYHFDENVCDLAKKIKPSKRNELEISDLINLYFKNKNAEVFLLNRGTVWFDAGTPQSLIDANLYINTLEQRLGIGICCPEEVAYFKKFITLEELNSFKKKIKNTDYIKYFSK